MYDIHSHILPNIDDGTKRMEEAILFAKFACKEGITHMVVTPHVHHPLNFKAIDIRAELNTLKKALMRENIQLTLYSGAENYISRKRINDIDELELTSINNTKYILIEFARDVTIREIDHGLHELRLLGYLPIIAHIEIYSCFYGHTQELIGLRRDGTYFQGNANHLFEMSKSGRSLSHYIRLGLIDFISTDAHGMKHRKPKLRKAYYYICHKFGNKTADNLFVNNGRDMLAGKLLPVNYKDRSRTWRKPPLVMTMVLILIMILSSVIIHAHYQEKVKEEKIKPVEINTQSIETVIPIVKHEFNEESPLKVLGIDLLDNDQDETNDKNIENEMIEPQETIHDVEETNQMDELVVDTTESEVLTHEEKLIQAYINYLEALEDLLLTEIDVFYQELKEIGLLEDENEQKSQALIIKDQIRSLEIDVDNDVNKTLYDMQNDLEEYNYDTAIIQELRDAYFETKSRVSAEYEAKLNNLK